MSSKQRTSVFDRLTDTKLYTGAHKHRFDEYGNGRGLDGRDRVAKGHGFIAGAPGSNVADLSQITRSNLNTSGAGYIPPPSPRSPTGGPLLYQRGGSTEGQIMALPPSPTGPGTPSPRPGSVGRYGLGRSSYSGGAAVPLTPSSGATRTSDTGERKPSIFDRLNDPSSYTGMHKNRFSADGRGRGAVGRTTPNAYVSPMDNVRR